VLRQVKSMLASMGRLNSRVRERCGSAGCLRRRAARVFEGYRDQIMDGITRTRHIMAADTSAYGYRLRPTGFVGGWRCRQTSAGLG
jgi:hypothetical protein